tara:strand:+ start:4890 stop:5174 length:285 start_codon:yes stop_codon:yes gene_type:complete
MKLEEVTEQENSTVYFVEVNNGWICKDAYTSTKLGVIKWINSSYPCSPSEPPDFHFLPMPLELDSSHMSDIAEFMDKMLDRKLKHLIERLDSND